MNCPRCNTPDLEIGNYRIHTTEATVEVHYAICNVLDLEADPNWGNGYPCGFFIVRESKASLLREVLALTNTHSVELKCPDCNQIIDVEIKQTPRQGGKRK